jgi:hypothetical protein
VRNLPGPAAHVVDKALAYVFSKDRDFQDFLRTPEAAHVTPSLRVRRASASDMEQPQRKPATGVECADSVQKVRA